VYSPHSSFSLSLSVSVHNGWVAGTEHGWQGRCTARALPRRHALPVRFACVSLYTPVPTCACPRAPVCLRRCAVAPVRLSVSVRVLSMIGACAGLGKSIGRWTSLASSCGWPVTTTMAMSLSIAASPAPSSTQTSTLGYAHRHTSAPARKHTETWRHLVLCTLYGSMHMARAQRHCVIPMVLDARARGIGIYVGGGIISARRERQGEGEGPMSCRSWAYGCAVRSVCAVLLTMGWACAGGVLSAPAAHGFGQVPSTHDRARPQPHPAARQGVCAREPRPPSAPPP
jgi:hypothetical protein